MRVSSVALLVSLCLLFSLGTADILLTYSSLKTTTLRYPANRKLAPARPYRDLPHFAGMQAEWIWTDAPNGKDHGYEVVL